MRAFSFAAPLGREKNSHSPVCDSIFLGLSAQKSDDMSSRPTKILKISAFRDFFVTEPKCQKGAKNRVKTRFLRRISILCSSYVPLTQSGYFLQNGMAGVNPCRNGHSTKSMRHILNAVFTISFPKNDQTTRLHLTQVLEQNIFLTNLMFLWCKIAACLKQ